MLLRLLNTLWFCLWKTTAVRPNRYELIVFVFLHVFNIVLPSFPLALFLFISNHWHCRTWREGYGVHMRLHIMVSAHDLSKFKSEQSSIVGQDGWDLFGSVGWHVSDTALVWWEATCQWTAVTQRAQEEDPVEGQDQAEQKGQGYSQRLNSSTDDQPRGRCVVMEGPPNAVPTHCGGIHGDPVTSQHHGTHHTGKPVESSKEHTYQGRGGRGAKRPTSLRLIRNDWRGQQNRPSEHVQ